MLPIGPNRLGFSRLQGKMLAIVVPIFLLICAASVTIFELNSYADNKDKLLSKLEQVTQTFTTVVSEPLWNVDPNRLNSILEAIAIDPDFVSAIVFDDEGEVFAQIKITDEKANSILSYRQPIILRSESGQNEW